MTLTRATHPWISLAPLHDRLKDQEPGIGRRFARVGFPAIDIPCNPALVWSGGKILG